MLLILWRAVEIKVKLLVLGVMLITNLKLKRMSI
jgi:hypothetical protein